MNADAKLKVGFHAMNNFNKFSKNLAMGVLFIHHS